MTIESMLRAYIGIECQVYTADRNVVDCIPREVGNGWLRVTERMGEDSNYHYNSIILIKQIVKIWENPQNYANEIASKEHKTAVGTHPKSKEKNNG